MNATTPSRVPTYYIPPLGRPMYWEDETSGELRGAMNRLIGAGAGGEDDPGPETFQLIKEYLVYFIKAPFWRRGAMFASRRHEEQLDWWINEAENLTCVRDAFKLLQKWTKAGIDPLGGRGIYQG